LIVAIAVAPASVKRKWFDAHPLPFILFSFLNSVALFLVLFRYAYRAMFWLVVWLFLVCLSSLLISIKVRNPDAVRKTRWEKLALGIIPLVFLTYATKPYPEIRHEVGGGAAVPIVLHLTKTLRPFDSDRIAVSLIDETEQGYYVLRESDKALFVARGLVEDVEFLNTSQTASSVPSTPQH
jgi:hypothetical protein